MEYSGEMWPGGVNPATEPDDYSRDPHRWTREVHYRLYLDRSGEPVVVCVQDFDYLDYDARRFLSMSAWDDECEADAALTRWKLRRSLTAELTGEQVELALRMLARLWTTNVLTAAHDTGIDLPDDESAAAQAVSDHWRGNRN